MKELLDQAAEAEDAGLKLGVTAGAMACWRGCLLRSFYSDLAADDIGAQRSSAIRDREGSVREAQAASTWPIASELRPLQEEQRELLRALPKRAEIPIFISNIQEQAELAGLEVLNIVDRVEVPQDLT